jgi:hypothetical protein
MGLDGSCGCAFGAISVACVTPPYPTHLGVCVNIPSFNTGCVSYPNTPSPFAYAHDDPNYSSLFTTHAVLLTLNVTGNIPIVYIGSYVSPGYTPVDANQGVIVATPWQNIAPQNPNNVLIYYNHSGSIKHLLPPSFPSNADFWVWGLCIDFSITERDKVTGFLPGCTVSTPNQTTIGIDDKVVCFYDTTSMASSIITKAAQTVQQFLSDLNYTNPHYHYKVAGERYLQWPLSLIQSGQYPQDYLHNGYGPALTTGQGNLTIAHNDCAVGAGFGGIQEVNPTNGLAGIDSLTTTSPYPALGTGPYNDVVCLLFCDEAAGGVYYGITGTNNNDCQGTRTSLAVLPGNPFWGEFGTNHSDFWIYGLLQGLSTDMGGFLETDYVDYLNSYSTLNTNNIRTYIFQEGPAPSPDLSIGGLITNSSGTTRRKAMTQHLFRMFGGNNIYDNLVTAMNVIDQTYHSWFNFSRIDNSPGNTPTALTQYLSANNPDTHDRYTQGFPYYHSSPGGTTYANALPASVGPYEIGHCNLNYWAEQIIGVGADWSLRHYNFEGWFPMGSGTGVYDDQYEPVDVNDRNDPSTTGIYTDLNGNPLDSLGVSGETKWPNRLYFELWKMVTVVSTVVTYTTETGCLPGTPCENVCDLEIKVFKDVDGDCIRDNNEPLAAHIDIPIIDPQGALTVYNTGQGGYINLHNIEVGFYTVAGKVCDLSTPCKVYTAEIPLYEKKFNSGTLGCIFGCTDSTATNYNPQATVDDGSCEYLGCTNECAMNYDPQATIDDGTCCPCLDLEYRIEPSVQAYEHTIEITIEFPNNSIQVLGTGPSGVYNYTGLPGQIYQETFNYIPGQGILGPNGVIGNGTSFKPDLSSLAINGELCGTDINCWVLRFDIKSNETALDYDNMSYTNIQMGTFEFSTFSNVAKYIYIPFDEGSTYMGNAVGGAPWPTPSQLTDQGQWSYYVQNIFGPWAATAAPAQIPDLSLFQQSSLFYGAVGWSLNFFNIGIINGLNWLANNGYVSQPVYNPSSGLLENKPFMNGLPWAVKSNGFNPGNVCGDPPCGCTDPAALNYNPAANQPCINNAGTYHGRCIYDCQKIVVDVYWVTVRMWDNTRVAQSNAVSAAGAWTYQAVYRDDSFPATPGLGYYNGIPLAKLEASGFPSDIQFAILDEQDNVLFTSGVIPHPRAATGDFRLRWGCYDDGTFMSSGAPAGFVDGQQFYIGYTNNNMTAAYVWATSTTSSGIDIATARPTSEWGHLFASYTCEALMCAEDSCLKFKRLGTYAKGWESMGAIISVYTDEPIISGAGIGAIPNTLLGNYHIPPGWYKLNLSKQGLQTEATSIWATNWEDDRASVFGVNPVTPHSPWAWDVDTVFEGQYWSLWGCNIPGGEVPTGGYDRNMGTVLPRLGCTDPLSNDFDLFATKSNGICNRYRDYYKFTTIKITIGIGGSDMLNREQARQRFDSTNSDIGRKPYDTGTRSLTTAQKDATVTLEGTHKVANFFELVLKRDADANEDKLSDGAQTHMEFARVLERNVKMGKKYTYEIDVPYGERVGLDIIDTFARDFTYKIEQLGNIKTYKNGPKKI